MGFVYAIHFIFGISLITFESFDFYSYASHHHFINFNLVVKVGNNLMIF